MSDAYTTLAVGPRGVYLRAAHEARLARGDRAVVAAFRAWCATATVGVWALRVRGGQIEATARAASSLTDGLPASFVVSPFAGSGTPGPFAKPAPPSPYDAVRTPGEATLLTSADGARLWEGSVAALLAWDGHRLVAVPDDTPRVASLAEAHVAAELGVARGRLLVAHDWPLLLINAVVLTCAPRVAGRAPFPINVRAALHASLEATAGR